MSFLYIFLAMLLFSPRVWPAPNTSLLGRLSIDANTPSAEITLGMDGAIKAESGIYLSMDSFDIGCWHLSMETENFTLFTGSAAIEGGFAFRTKPHASPATLPATLWSAKTGAAASSLVFGMASKGLSFCMLCEPDGAAVAGEKADLPAVLEESLRLAGLEYVAQYGELSAGLAASMADRPLTASGDGWKAGESSEPGSTHCVIASAARLQRRRFLAGAWASASGGYLENPGWAASLELEADIGTKAEPALRLASSVFASSAAYLSPQGNTDPYDFSADAQASIRIKPWSLSIRCAAASLKEPPLVCGKKPLARSDAATSDLLSWLWKIDQARASFGLEFDTLALAARLNADAYGLKNGAIDLHWTGVAGASATRSPVAATFGAAISARFARSGGIVEDSTGEIGEESGEETSPDSETPANSCFSSGLSLDGFRLGELDFECSIGWGGAWSGAIRNGKFQILVSLKNMDTKPTEIVLSGSLTQKFHVGSCAEASLSIKCPRGGYSLEATTLDFPLLELALAF